MSLTCGRYICTENPRQNLKTDGVNTFTLFEVRFRRLKRDVGEEFSEGKGCYNRKPCVLGSYL